MAADQKAPSAEKIQEALRLVEDPELRMSVVDLGLIYGVDIQENGHVQVTMTLTTPGCPLNEYIPDQIRQAVGRVEGVESVDVDLVWEPRWTPDMMSEEAKQALRWGGFNI